MKKNILLLLFMITNSAFSTTCEQTKSLIYGVFSRLQDEHPKNWEYYYFTETKKFAIEMQKYAKCGYTLPPNDYTELMQKSAIKTLGNSSTKDIMKINKIIKPHEKNISKISSDAVDYYRSVCNKNNMDDKAILNCKKIISTYKDYDIESENILNEEYRNLYPHKYGQKYSGAQCLLSERETEFYYREIANVYNSYYGKQKNDELIKINKRYNYRFRNHGGVRGLFEIHSWCNNHYDNVHYIQSYK